jgi:glycosyltransferase involved in cell wall biosynthesis
MKILEIIYSLASGGAERFVVDLSNELSEMNNTVILCTAQDDSKKNFGFYKDEISPKVKYINLKFKEGFDIKNVYHFWRLLKELKPDVVHCHLNIVNYILPLSIFFPKIRFIHTIHNDAEKEVKSKTEFYVRKFFYSFKFFKAITISNETSQSFIKFYKNQNYFQIYNGRKQPVSTVQFENVKKFVDDIRLERKMIFIHVGRCNRQKNQQMLINVFNRIISEDKSVALLVIGAGFESDLGQSLKRISSNQIYFLGQKENVVDYFLNSDAFCLSSIHEGMPITLIEAFACGCIPICTPVGGISDSIKNEVTGYLSKSVSENDYYDAMMAYINDNDKIKKESLIKHYNSNFSIGECAALHLELFNGNT